MPIHFGTDGWRAVIGEEFTFDNVRQVAQAIADYLHEANPATDAPIAGRDLQAALNVDGLTGRVEVERELVVIVAAAGELALALGSRRREPPPRCTAEKATHEEM